MDTLVVTIVLASTLWISVLGFIMTARLTKPVRVCRAPISGRPVSLPVHRS